MDLIIGAGATGLSYASFTPNPYLVVDADTEPGGYCKTVRRDGFVWDYSGHFFHFRDPQMEEWLCANIRPEIIRHVEKQTQIYYKGKYVDFPFQMNIHQLDKEEFIDCLYDLFNRAGGDYTTFKGMLYSKFGPSIADKFLIPYNTKLYATDLDNLDSDAMGRFFPYADKEKIIANFRAKDAAASYNAHFTYPETGAIEYINSLLARLNPANISLGERVLAIDLVTKTARTNRRLLTYDNLISTIPFPELLRLCGIDADPTVYSWNKVLVFNFGFDAKGKDTTNNWVYFPDKDLSFYRIGYYDNILGSDRMSLYIELGFPKDARIDVAHWRERVLDDLARAGITEGCHPVAEHHVVMNPAYVHISQASQKDVAAKKKLLAQHHVYSIGRYGSWTYCSIEDGMIEARELSRSLAAKSGE